jgi:hypothetical protein
LSNEIAVASGGQLADRIAGLGGKSFQPSVGKPQGGLKPWREVVTPHPDVAKGTYQQAEFAAGLWQVYQGTGTDEYKHPAEFLRRTLITQGFERQLSQAIRRLTGEGGDPVVELQTNFGGGKTHKSPRPSGERSAEPGLGVDRAQRRR